MQTCGQILGKLSVALSSDGVLKHLGDLDVDKLVLLGNLDCLLLSLGAGGSHKDNTLGTSGSLGLLQLENADNLLKNLLFTLGAVELCDKTRADLLDTLHVNVGLTDGVLRELSDVLLFTLDDGIVTGKQVTNPLLTVLIGLVEQDKVIGQDSHLLHSNSLSLSSWETFNNVGALLILHLLNLEFQKFDDNLILDVAVGLAGLLDFLAEAGTLRDFLVNKITDGDASDVASGLSQVLGEGECNLLTTAAWRSQQDNAEHLRLFKLLDQMVNGVSGALRNK